jgi:hypothetical protein
MSPLAWDPGGGVEELRVEISVFWKPARVSSGRRGYFKILNSASARLLVSDGDDMASVNPKYSTTCVEAAAFGSGRLEEHAD